MRPTAVLINTARGGIVDTAALVEALQQGFLAGAGLDVLEQEPLDPASPLLRMEQVIVTPHAAWYSEEGRSDLKRRAAEEAVRVLRGERPRHCVNPEVLGRMRRRRRPAADRRVRAALRRGRARRGHAAPGLAAAHAARAGDASSTSPTAGPRRTSCARWRASGTARRGSRRCPRTSGASAWPGSSAATAWTSGTSPGARAAGSARTSSSTAWRRAPSGWSTTGRTPRSRRWTRRRWTGRRSRAPGSSTSRASRPRSAPGRAGVFERAVESAQASGALLSLDVNHRTALWTYEAARAYLEPLLARVGLLFVGIEDARRVFGLAGEPEAVAAGLRGLAPAGDRSP